LLVFRLSVRKEDNRSASQASTRVRVVVGMPACAVGRPCHWDYRTVGRSPQGRPRGLCGHQLVQPSTQVLENAKIPRACWLFL